MTENIFRPAPSIDATALSIHLEMLTERLDQLELRNKEFERAFRGIVEVLNQEL